MAEQEKRKVHRHESESETEEEDVAAGATESETSERLDDLLEEIDTVLEENAEEFVKNYVQKGGE